MTPEQLIAAFETLGESADAVQRLRELVLQLAVRGKLVPQDPNDEPASELLKRIASEKAKLVSDGKIRATKQFPLDGDGFDVPLGWISCTLQSVVLQDVGGGTPSKREPRFWGGGIPWASVKDVGKSKYLDATIDQISRVGLESSSSNLIPENWLVVCVRMGLDKVSITKTKVAINQDLRALEPASELVLDYLYLVMNAGTRVGTGMTVKGIRREQLLGAPFPLPPLNEQKRIVARVDELMGVLDALEDAQTRRDTTRRALRDSALYALQIADTPQQVTHAWERVRDHLDDLCREPEDVQPIRQTVLQLAVRGRLVPQDPNDEPASELLKRIAAEKTKLATEGKIRKPKKLPPIDPDETPFDLPTGWEWCRINDVAVSLNYGTSEKSNQSGRLPVLRMGNLQDGKIDWNNLKYTSDPAIEKRYSLRPGSVLFNRTNSAELVGKTALYRGEQPAAFAGYLIHIAQANEVSSEFLNLVMNSPHARDWCWTAKSDGISQSNISGSKLATMLFPLPPLNEQKRIVARVDEIMAILDQLEQRLSAQRETQSAFANSAIHHLKT